MYKILIRDEHRKVNTILTLTEMKYHNQNIELKKNERLNQQNSETTYFFN